jgi:retinoid hydroxylase
MAVSLSDSPLPPGSSGLPWIGETIAWVRDPLRFAQDRYDRYGPVWRTHLMGRPCAVLLGPDANRFMLSTHMHLFSSRLGWGKPITTLIGDGLSLIDGAQHRRHRRMIQPALHGVMLHRYFDVMQALTRQHLDAWLRRERLTLFDAFKHLSFGIAARLMLGARNTAEIDRFAHEFHIFTAGLFAPPAWKIPWTPYGRAWHSRRALRRTLAEIIADRRARPHSDDILGLLLEAEDEAGQRFTDDELIDELLVLLWAGHDTVTSLLTWTVLELLRHPDIYAGALDEQQRLIGAGDLALSQLKAMPFLDRVLRESERMHPPAPGGFRGVVESFEYGGYRIPAGWTVMYSIVWTHNMPDIWSNPDRFDPDRFAPPRSEGRPFALIGFGGGPRVCVGLAFAQMQMRIVLSHMLRHLRLDLLPDQSFAPVAVPTKMPKDGLIVRVSRRA